MGLLRETPGQRGWGRWGFPGEPSSYQDLSEKWFLLS